MFGIGKLFGSVAGGLLDKIGLGGLAPFVKLGLNALTGNWLGVAQDVFNLVSNFKGNPLDQAANRPPLGGFDGQSNQFAAPEEPQLDSNRLSDLFKGLSKLFQGLRAFSNGNEERGFGRILNAFRLLNESFGNNQLFNNRLSFSQYTNIRL